MNIDTDRIINWNETRNNYTMARELSDDLELDRKLSARPNDDHGVVTSVERGTSLS